MAHKISMLLAEARELFLQIDNANPEADSKQELCKKLVFDLSTIANYISGLDNKISEEEKKVITVFLRFPFMDKRESDYLESWNILDNQERQSLFDAVNQALELAPKLLPAKFESINFFVELIKDSSKIELAHKFATHLYRFAVLLAKVPSKMLTDSQKKALNQTRQIIQQQLSSLTKSVSQGSKSALDQELLKLNNLIGLEQVKQEVQSLINLLRLQENRKKAGLKISEISMHAVFTGAPGTGKTTVARIYANILKALGFLSTAVFVETDRAGLVAEYVGQTAAKVEKLVAQAKGGVLFIDEAYSLLNDKGQGDFGKEAVEALLKRMEDLRDDFVVIVAGYSEEMQIFLESNPGLSSRFSRKINFSNYNSEQLQLIFRKFVADNDYKLDSLALKKLTEVCDRMLQQADKSFGNARAMRNLFEQTILNQANRLASQNDLSRDMLETLSDQDLTFIKT